MTTHRVVSEREIYLDSDYASYERSHEFEFKLDPPVQTDMNQKAYISVRHFSCLNTLKNITIDRRQFAVARLVNGVSLTYNREIPDVTSDRRIKENIKDIEDDDALKQLRLLKPKTYEYQEPT